MAEVQAPLRRLTVLRCEHIISTGEKNGKEWTLWSVDIADAEGNPIDERFKSFTKLPQGPGEFEVEKQSYEGKVSYLLKPKKGARMEALEKQVADLQVRVAALEAQGQTPNYAPPPAQQQREDDAKWGSDAPF